MLSHPLQNHLFQIYKKTTSSQGAFIVSICIFIFGGGDPYRFKVTICIEDYRHN